MKIQRNESGKLDAFAWPGGYPIVYITQDGGILCPECANGENGSEANEANDDSQWKLVACDVHYEDTYDICDHCNKKLESAYGSPE